ncbi:MAG: hypothetical protein JWN98_91 [Abditibacteriota bacterium]|jgi:GxxExxY protein|nr:hypothetical protein [Abditibacteriota bacterium]
MRHNEVSSVIIDAALEVHRALGPGLLGSVYENALAYELELRGLRVQHQVPVPVVYKAIRFEIAFRADLIVDDFSCR